MSEPGAVHPVCIIVHIVTGAPVCGHPVEALLQAAGVCAGRAFKLAPPKPANGVNAHTPDPGDDAAPEDDDEPEAEVN